MPLCSFPPRPAALRPVRCKRFQADMKMRAPPSHLKCNRYRAPLANSMQKYITFRVMSAAARKSERKGSKRIRRRRLRFTDLILKTRLCIRWKNGCTDHFSTYSTSLPSFSGNELSREIPRASLAARMVTSRHVTRTHSMKAINACE